MATLTINTTGAQDTRIVAAFGRYLQLGRNATAAEVKAEVIKFLRAVVAQQEEAMDREAIPVRSPIDPT